MNQPFNGTFLVDEIETAIDTDAIILGVPYEDNSTIYTKGASLAPNKIREMSNFFSGQSISTSNIHTLNVLDFGNLKVENKSYNDLVTMLANSVAKIIGKGAVPIIIGGDHSIALGTATGIKQSKKKFDAIVWIDAHLDLMDNYPDDEKFTRATVLRRILDLKLVPEENIYFIGPRGHNLGSEEVELMTKEKINCFTSMDFRNPERITEYLKTIKSKHNSIYLSLDIDVLDPAFAPGISVPEPGGITSRELFHILRILANKIACFEIVEINPHLDLNDLTSLTACRIIFEFLDAYK